MLIHADCDLTALAERMGPCADRRDAWAMRELLIWRGYGQADTESVPPDLWGDMLDVAVGLRGAAPRWLLLMNAEPASEVRQ